MIHTGNALNKDALGRKYFVVNEGTRYSNYSGDANTLNVQNTSLEAIEKSLNDIKATLKSKESAKADVYKQIEYHKQEIKTVNSYLEAEKKLLAQAVQDNGNDEKAIGECKAINSTFPWKATERSSCLDKYYARARDSYARIQNHKAEILKYEEAISFHNSKITEYNNKISVLESDINEINKDISLLSNQKLSAIAVINQNTLSANIEELKALTTQKNIALEEKKVEYQYDLGQQSIGVSKTIADAQTDPKIASISASLQEAKEVENTKKMALIVGVLLVVVFVGLKFIKK